MNAALQSVERAMKPTIYDELRVRIATVADMPEIMELAIAASKENALFDTTPAHLARIVWPCLHLDHGIIGTIGKQKGVIEGMVVMVVGTLGYSDQPCCEEKVLFVRPEFRNAKGGRANKLIHFMKGVSTSLSLPLLTGILSNADTRAKVGLYTRELGEPAGAFWVWGGQKTGGHSVT